MVEEFVRFLKHPQWRSQHSWRRAIWSTMSHMGLTGLHALPVYRSWVEFSRQKMPLRGLDPALEGMTIVQISDLHYSPVVWRRYLVQFVRWVNELHPDLVVVTGDLITGGYRFAENVATILSHLRAKHGVVCTFGNHDYSVYGKNTSPEGKRRADYLEECLLEHKLIVLRNGHYAIHHNGSKRPLVLVGLDDEWSGHIDPPRAFSGVDPSLPIVCLNHNPANCAELMKYPWQWMLSGHTHGRQVATSLLGRRLYPHRYRHYTHGYYSVKVRHLYVNRGLAYGQRVQHWCRPEVTVFKLTGDTGERPANANGNGQA
jgi:predicted MPP superfamily phosphohydrolase